MSVPELEPPLTRGSGRCLHRAMALVSTETLCPVIEGPRLPHVCFEKLPACLLSARAGSRCLLQLPTARVPTRGARHRAEGRPQSVNKRFCPSVSDATVRDAQRGKQAHGGRPEGWTAVGVQGNPSSVWKGLNEGWEGATETPEASVLPRKILPAEPATECAASVIYFRVGRDPDLASLKET